MRPSFIVSTAFLTAAMGMPALAHTEHLPHTHAGQVSWSLALLGLAAPAALVLLRHRMMGSRS